MTDTAAMPCPVCRVPLVMSERQGVEIDHCPKCRGVWLDRGELDKLIDRSVDPFPAEPARRGDDDRYDEDRQGDEHWRRGREPRKRRGFLGEMFDFD